MIHLTKTQLENIENKSMLILPIDKTKIFNSVANWCKKHSVSPYDSYWYNKALIFTLCPVQKGDKDIWIAEDYFYIEQTKEYLFKDMFFNGKITLNETYNISDFSWQPYSQMTKEQSRHTISEILDVRVVRVHDIPDSIFEKLGLQIHGGVQIADTDCYGDTYYTVGTPKESDCGMYIENLYNEEQFDLAIDELLGKHGICSTYEDNDYVFLVEYKY